MKTIPKYKIDNRKLTRLVEKAQGGSAKACEEIVNLISGYLYYYCLTLLGDEEAARDAVQDILLTMLKKLNTLENPAAFLGWIKTVAANYCKTRLTRERDNYSLDEGTWELEDCSDQIRPEKAAETAEACSLVRAAVKALPVTLRESVMLFYFHQMSVRQIAETLEVNENTVKSRLFSARKNMKQYLEQYGGAALALCPVPPLSLVSFSLIDEAESVKGVLVPYATPEGAVKVAAVNAAAAAGSVTMKVAAIGAACLVAAGSIGAAAASGLMKPDDARPHPQETTVPMIIEPKDGPNTVQFGTRFVPEPTAPGTVPSSAATLPAETSASVQQDVSIQPAPYTIPPAAQAAAATAPTTVPPTTAAPTTVPAEKRVYIDTSAWAAIDATQVFCHIYDADGNAPYSYGSKQEYCTAVSGTLYAYDLSALDLSDSAQYSILFGTKNGAMTRALTFTAARYGGTVLTSEDPTLAPTDSSHKTYLVAWK